MAMLGVSFAAALGELDQTIVGTGLPTIVAELKGFEFYPWVSTFYLLTSIITIPIFGCLGDYYGRKPFVITSIIIFSSASALCGVADNMVFLVLARGLQGIGSGMLVGTAFACIPDLFPDPVIRLRWQVIMSSAFGIANTIGPSLGGILTEHYGWRSIFYINLPVGLLSLYFVWLYLPHLRHTECRSKIRLDWLGALLIALLLGCLQLFVELLPKYGATRSVDSLLVVCIVSAYALWKWEKRCTHAILPIDLLRDKNLSMLFTSAMLIGFVMFSLLIYVPLLFQGGFGMSSQDVGLTITPLVAFITIGSIANARIVSHISDPKLMLGIGFVLLTVTCLGVIAATPVTQHWLLMVIMITGGVGLGFTIPNQTILVQQIANRQCLGIATALLQSLRMVGGMIGIALTGALASHLYTNGVYKALENNHAGQWFAALQDPQILINRNAQAALLNQLGHTTHNGKMLFDAAREVLITAIHTGLTLATLIAAVSIWQSHRLPQIKLQRSPEPTADPVTKFSTANSED